MTIQRVFSGIQPTGNLHLGNYLGAIVNFVKMQETHNCVYCVVDLHAITVPPAVWGGPDELRRNIREVTAAFIASGIDPKRQIIFKDNHVEHWLNGAKIVEYTWGSDAVKALAAKSKFADKPRFMAESEGHIVFQHHGQEFWIRNIRVRKL